ncbi:MAG: hypothetical protein BWY82_01604 [Verrucomicrobia bacterium ADurb.Bin474]|nr:MAG: hypothetical protein BWY82_01604 [Verrucomicrobia bacterium ADurb.Bin474]
MDGGKLVATLVLRMGAFFLFCFFARNDLDGSWIARCGFSYR